MKTTTDKNRAVVLMYHDVVERDAHKLSGFPSADAALYKLEPEQFDRHLMAIRDAVTDGPLTVGELLADEPGPAWMLTFDDGGVSAGTRIAGRLEELGWRAHFFISTDYIGTPAFLSAGQIRELDARGHIIGSHSCSHPLRFASRPYDELKREWSDSVSILSDLLGKPIKIASIPGGQYSRQVTETAAESGIDVLFTSEPTTSHLLVNGCRVIGRYSIQRSMSPSVAAGMASGKLSPRLKQKMWWETMKIVKAVGGNTYLKLRESWMDAVN